VDDSGQMQLEVRLQVKDFRRILSRLGIDQEQYLPQGVD
jgi:GTP-binding protein HflX